MSKEKEIKQTVGEHYAQLARQAAERGAASCCSPEPSCCSPAESQVANPISGSFHGTLPPTDVGTTQANANAKISTVLAGLNVYFGSNWI